jgi:DNA invertase Pin-like site-specific DNA recombinase
MKCAMYARVSSDGQDYEDQFSELRAFAKRQQWEDIKTLSAYDGKDYRAALSLRRFQ